MAGPERPLVGANCNLVNIVKILQVVVAVLIHSQLKEILEKSLRARISVTAYPRRDSNTPR